MSSQQLPVSCFQDKPWTILLENVKKTGLIKNWICCIHPLNVLYRLYHQLQVPRQALIRSVASHVSMGWNEGDWVWIYELPPSSTALLPTRESASAFLAFVPFDWRLDYLTLWPVDTFKASDTFYLTAFHKGSVPTLPPTVQECQSSSILTKTEHKAMNGRW